MNEFLQGLFIVSSIFFILYMNKEFLVDKQNKPILLSYKQQERINHGKKRRKKKSKN